MAVVRKFVHLLDQSDQDFQEELELMKLREEVVTLIRSNQQLENDLNLMDIKIGLLVKNKITLQVGNALMGDQLQIELSPEVVSMVSSWPWMSVAQAHWKTLLQTCRFYSSMFLLHSTHLVCIPGKKTVGGEETRPEAKKDETPDYLDLMNATDFVFEGVESLVLLLRCGETSDATSLQ